MKGFLVLLLFAINITLFAQDFDKIVPRESQYDCPQVAGGCALLFKRYLAEDRTDSAGMLLTYWQGKCGLMEPVRRAGILLAMKVGIFSDSLLTSGFLNHLKNYQQRVRVSDSRQTDVYNHYQGYFGFVPPGKDFDRYTQQQFYELKKEFAPGTEERLICGFYSDETDSLFTRLQKGEYAGTFLARQYQEALEVAFNRVEGNFALITGIYIPTGDASVLGVHPELGMQFGAKYRRFNADLSLVVRFLKSANEYYAHRKKSGDSLELTDHFVGGYIGLDLGYDIIQRRRNELSLVGGVAMDGFDALEENEALGLKSESVWSWNVNFGLGYRFYFSPSFYLGLKARYNLVDYSASGVVDFTGNPVTVELIIGGLSNNRKKSELEMLDYPWRR